MPKNRKKTYSDHQSDAARDKKQLPKKPAQQVTPPATPVVPGSKN